MSIKNGQRAVLLAASMAMLLGTTSMQAMAATDQPNEQPAATMNVVSVAAKAAPAIVTVEIRKADDGSLHPMFSDRDMFQEFAQRFGMRFPDPLRMPMFPGARTTTGLIVSEDGQIVTSGSEIDGATSIRVTLENGLVYDASVVGIDALTDIAVLKIDANSLPTLNFANPEDLQLGEPIVVVGANSETGNAVSTGVLSAVNDSGSATPLFDLVQTDAAVGVDTSGGVILNSDGEVVGVNARHIASVGGLAGVNVAIPGVHVAEVVADLVDDGQVDRGFLGVQITPVSDDVALALGLETAFGAFVTDVAKETPAEAAGLKRGDIVLSVDGQDVRTPRDLTRLIASKKPGEEVVIQTLRAGQPMPLTVVLGARAEHKA